MSRKRQRLIYVQHRRVRLLLVALVAVFAVAGVTGAAASPPTSVSGSFTTTSSSATSVRFDGGNLILEESGIVSYTGTFSGTSTFHGILIIHADGSANFHDVETFTGRVNGVSGTLTLNLNGRNDSTRAVQATDTIVSATGELAGLHGVLSEVGTVTGPPGPLGTYTGQIQSGSA